MMAKPLLVSCALVIISLPVLGEELRIEKWPDDVPCNAVHRNSDGSFTQEKGITLSFRNLRMSDDTFAAETAEARLWAVKCNGKTGKDT
jgi:hypothetical protein